MTTSYSPVLTTKAVKDETEQRILRDAHVRHMQKHKCATPSRELDTVFIDRAICCTASGHRGRQSYRAEL